MATATVQAPPVDQAVHGSDVSGEAKSGELAPDDIGLSDALFELALLAAEDGDTNRGYRDVANRLRDQLHCHSVAIGLHSGLRRKCALKAISGIPQFRRHSPLASCMEDVLNEALLLTGIRRCNNRTATESQKRLNQLCHTNELMCGPVRDRNGITIGSFAILQDESQNAVALNDFRSAPDDEFRELPTQLGRCLGLLHRCRPRFLEQLNRLFTGNAGRIRSRIIVSAIAAFCFLMLLPLRYQVKCDCEVQAATRRFIPVPYDGVLQEALAEPGDVVQGGQVLARMDRREIQWQLAASQAEYNQSKKKYEVQLAARETSAAQVARLEMDRLNLRIQLLEHQAANLEIQSPIAGVVVSGDPKKKERARLARGESLFEVSPLDQMIIELLVPDHDIRHVRAGQKVKIRLDAFPGKLRHGQIIHVSPRAEARNQANVFVAEVELDNGDRALRPGMLGRGRIATVRRPLVWNLFQRPWNRLVYHVAW